MPTTATIGRLSVHREGYVVVGRRERTTGACVVGGGSDGRSLGSVHGGSVPLVGQHVEQVRPVLPVVAGSAGSADAWRGCWRGESVLACAPGSGAADDRADRDGPTAVPAPARLACWRRRERQGGHCSPPPLAWSFTASSPLSSRSGGSGTPHRSCARSRWTDSAHRFQRRRHARVPWMPSHQQATSTSARGCPEVPAARFRRHSAPWRVPAGASCTGLTGPHPWAGAVRASASAGPRRRGRRRSGRRRAGRRSSRG